MNPAEPRSRIEQLGELFGSYKAEWSQELIFQLFTRPDYFPELETARPCVLIGGRGTGKTTVLRSLSYEGRDALPRVGDADASTWPYYGFYYRVDTNRVTAFDGPDLPRRTWTRVFGHYVNLLLCGQVIRFLDWYARERPGDSVLEPRACQTVSVSLHLEIADTVQGLLVGINAARVRFEAFLNDLGESDRIPLSLQGAPIDELMSAVARLPQFTGKRFFFIIDEYENFLDYQQEVMNTLIKHSGGHHTFKVGVRELGWRKRTTLNPNEQLTSPADYHLIPIAEKLDTATFTKFAADIINQRLARLDTSNGASLEVEHLLLGPSDEEEAEDLGVREKVALEVSKPGFSPGHGRMLLELPPLEAYFVLFWAKAQGVTPEQVLAERAAVPDAWQTRFANYRHAILFSIREGKAGLRKHYAGWDTFVLLSGANIRYLLELVHQALLQHERQGGTTCEAVGWNTQTEAAQAVAKSRVAEIQGLSIQGANLTKLVLGLGRVFQVLALRPGPHTPEVNQFHLSDARELQQDVSDLLTFGVMHLALVRSTANKLSNPTELKDYDYALHPVFAAFFTFSHRKKRKMRLHPNQLVGLVKDPTRTIREILNEQNRREVEDLPEQLRLFDGYYDQAT